MQHQLPNTDTSPSLAYQLNESQENLKKALEELNQLQNSIDECLWAVDVQARKVLQMSAACEKVYGYAPSDFLNNINLWMEVIHPADLKIIEKNNEILARGELVINQYRILHKDGSIRFVEAKIYPTLSTQGELTHVRGITRDITKEKKANKALLESEYLFRQFFENAHEAILVMDVETGRMCDYNQNALDLFKCTGSELLGTTPADISPSFQQDGIDSANKAINYINATLADGKTAFEWMFKNKEGKNIACEVRLNLITAFEKKLIRGSILDITERKIAERKLKQQEKFFSSLLENQYDGIALIDNNGKTIYQSRSGENITGYTLQEAQNNTMFGLVHPEEIEHLTIFFQTVVNSPGVPFTTQYRFLHKNGNYVWIEGTITNMLHDETINGFIANYRNIDERKNAEAKIAAFNESLEKIVKERTAELIQANQELESFSYTVSHDLQAPLRATIGFAKILLSDYKHQLDEEGKRFLQIICDSSTRMSCLIHDLLDFSKLGKEELTKKQVDMNYILRGVLDEIRFTTAERPFKFKVTDATECNCDPHLIKQVWLNLIGNAVKYSGKKQAPVIEVGSYTENNEIIYFVKDNGAGFDMRYADKLFGVFKRMHNNDEFEGTGVGLATVHRIVTRHGGRIWAEAKLGEGAAFYFTLAA
ncbi:MAG: PAS domain S-box protein [Chitinophagales bacterium]|nr:PAS domain S-box protein [Chitinophagales bacterium]